MNDLVNRFFEARKMMKQMAGQFGFGSRSATKRLAKKPQEGKKAQGTSGPTRQGGPARLPAGMPDLSQLPPSLNELPPGLGGIDQLPPGLDPSKLKFARRSSVTAAAPARRPASGADEGDLWVVDGGVFIDAGPGAETLVDGGFLVPGLVDAHCHVGLGPDGAVDRPTRPSARRRPTATPAPC